MIILFGWLILAGYLLNEGNTLWGSIVLLGGILLIICAGISGSNERAKARANQQQYWAHYYDEDQVQARKRMRKYEPVPYRDEGEDYEFFASIFEDD